MSGITDVVGALAMSYLDRTLKSGKSVTIPSLGITIEGDNVSELALWQIIQKRWEPDSPVWRGLDSIPIETARNEIMDLCDAIVAATQRAEAAEAQAMELRLALGATVERANRLAIWADRFGADQWRRGNAGKEPQEFDEWQKETQP